MCKKGFVMYHATGKLRHKRTGKKKKKWDFKPEFSFALYIKIELLSNVHYKLALSQLIFV